MALPQHPDCTPALAKELIETLEPITRTDSDLAARYFAYLSRHAATEFCGEAYEIYEKMKTRDIEQLIRAGTCWDQLVLSPGQKPGEILVEGRNADTDRRGIMPGDFVGVGPRDCSFPAIECEVVVARPMVLKPLVDGVMNMRGPLRMDKLGNRQQFSRVAKAVMCKE